MSVIAISKGSFLGGKLLARSLAKKLGYRCIDREVIVKQAAIAGVKPQKLRNALMEPPGLFDRLIDYHKYVYLSMLQAALANQVKDGKVVYHGYVGHLLLSDASPVFRVRVIASNELRLKMAQERLNLTRKAAAAHIQKKDQQRKKWTQALYGVDWEDPSLYDMVFNLGRLFEVEEASEIIASMVKEHSCFRFTSRQQAALKDFALAPGREGQGDQSQRRHCYHPDDFRRSRTCGRREAGGTHCSRCGKNRYEALNRISGILEAFHTRTFNKHGQPAATRGPPHQSWAECSWLTR
jgi:cytidylate kinase